MLSYFINYHDKNKQNIELSRRDIDIDVNIKNLDNHVTIDRDLFYNFIKINKIEYSRLITSYEKLITILNIKNTSTIDWKNLIGENKFNSYILDVKKILSLILSSNNSYYTKVLRERIDLTDLITRCMTSNGEYLTQSCYNHTDSVTGRVKITSGTNFLTMKKTKKSDLKAKKDYFLGEIDIKSCEPNLLYHILYGHAKNDIYKLTSNKNNINRSKIKLAVISTLYGAKVEKAKKLSGLSSKEIIKIRKLFKVDEINDYLENEFTQNKKIINMYGRSLYDNNCLINHWVQSSAADYCLLAFKKIVDQYDFEVKAIIHDAIIFEIHKKDKQVFNKIEKVTDPISNISLPIDKRILYE